MTARTNGSHLRKRKLGELFEVKHGYAFKSAYFAKSGPFVLLTPGNFKEEGGFDRRDGKEKFYDGPVPHDYILNRGDMLIAMTEQAEGLLGSSAIVPEDNRYLHNQRLGLVTNLRPDVDKTFLYYLFNTDLVRQQIRATASGTKVRHTSPYQIHEVEVLLPPLNHQQLISGILSAYDDLIENNTRRIAILEEMARNLYREWFVEFRFPGHEQVPLVESNLGLIPAGWSTGCFAELATIVRDNIVPERFANDLFDHFSIPSFDVNQLPSSEYGSTIKSSKYRLRQNCVLLSKINPRIPRVWLPACSNFNRAIASTEFLVLIPTSTTPLTYLHSLLLSDSFQHAFQGLALGTSTSHQRAKPADVLRLPVVRPAANLVAAFADFADPLQGHVHALRLKNLTLSNTRDILLPKLISGEIDVGVIGGQSWMSG